VNHVRVGSLDHVVLLYFSRSLSISLFKDKNPFFSAKITLVEIEVQGLGVEKDED